jgi:phosphorylcholine metabolism protein LicD
MSLEEYSTDPKYVKFLYKCFYELHNILIDFNIGYWATSGTLLGAIRHKGIIPIDDDVDLAISYKDVPIILSKEFKKALDKKGFYVKFHSESKQKATNGEKYDWIKINTKKKVAGRMCSIDLFTQSMEVDKKGKYCITFETPWARELWPKEKFYLDELLPLKQVPFGDGIIFAPKTPEPYLTRTYGKSWSTTMMVTQDQDHYSLETPIIIKSKRFRPAGEFASSDKQYRLKKDDILLTMKGTNLLI